MNKQILFLLFIITFQNLAQVTEGVSSRKFYGKLLTTRHIHFSDQANFKDNSTVELIDIEHGSVKIYFNGHYGLVFKEDILPDNEYKQFLVYAEEREKDRVETEKLRDQQMKQLEKQLEKQLFDSLKKNYGEDSIYLTRAKYESVYVYKIKNSYSSGGVNVKRSVPLLIIKDSLNLSNVLSSSSMSLYVKSIWDNVLGYVIYDLLELDSILIDKVSSKVRANMKKRQDEIVRKRKTDGQISLSPITTGLYVTSFNQDTKKASKMGVGISLSFNKFYMDFSGNFATGEGEYLDFSSQYTYPADKVNILVFNVGYIISVKSFNLIPFIGVGISSDIYQDPVAWDTYFLDEGVSSISIGIIGTINLSPNVRIQAGVGNYELFKAGISYVWGE